MMRLRWLNAWRAVVLSGYGDIKMRREYARRFNARRFWCQRAIPVPTVTREHQP